MQSSTSLGAAELLYELFGKYITKHSLTHWAQGSFYAPPTKEDSGTAEESNKNKRSLVRLKGYVLASERGVVVCTNQKPMAELPAHIAWHPTSVVDEQIYARCWRDGQRMGRWVCVQNEKVSLAEFVHNIAPNDPRSDLQSIYVDSGRVKISWSREALADLARRHLAYPQIMSIATRFPAELHFEKVLQAGAITDAIRTGGEVDRSQTISGFSDEDLAHCRAMYTRMRQYMPDLLSRLSDRNYWIVRKIVSAALIECAPNATTSE